MPLTLLLGLLLSSTASAQLERGIQLFNSFDQVNAEATLRGLLHETPSAAEAGKAHIYLGLIAFNDLKTEQARQEFAAAVRIAPAIELPFDVSPKARLLFDQIQRQVIEQEARRKTTAAQPRSPETLAPTAPENPSRVPAYVVGGIGLAGLAVGGIVAILAASDLGTANQLTTPIQTAQSKATQAGAEGLTADILFGVGGALAATGVVLWFLEAPRDTPAMVVPLPGGAALEISGSF